jgi:signal transduction histidine kinase
VSKTIQTRGPAFLEAQYRDEILHRYTHPVLDEDGQLESIVQFGRVVTKEKMLERQLIQSAKLASLGELAASIAHEVRNPLASISASAQVLRRKLERDTERREFTEMILLESRHLEELVNNLLDFARPSKSELKMVPLNDLLEETISLIVRQIEKQGVELVRNYDPGRPSAEIDERQIKQALLNVLINALQAMPEGGLLRVETASTERKVSITVADTGPGIPAENVEKIFQPFFSTKHQGAGLGLSIVKRIIEEHGGSISVENGGGAVFTISLPRLRTGEASST